MPDPKPDLCAITVDLPVTRMLAAEAGTPILGTFGPFLVLKGTGDSFPIIGSGPHILMRTGLPLKPLDCMKHLGSEFPRTRAVCELALELGYTHLEFIPCPEP